MATSTSSKTKKKPQKKTPKSKKVTTKKVTKKVEAKKPRKTRTKKEGAGALSAEDLEKVDVKGAYVLVPDPEDEKGWAVELVKAPYLGVIYRYGEIDFKEDKKGKNARLTGNVNIINEDKIPPIQDSATFNLLTGAILCDILTTVLGYTKPEK